MKNWNGEGLPPEGTECEVEWLGEWVKCKVIGHGVTDGQFSCIFQMKHDWEWLSSKNSFRLIKSDRDKAIEEMNKIHEKNKFNMSWNELFGEFYDAGYRKTEIES